MVFFSKVQKQEPGAQLFFLFHKVVKIILNRSKSDNLVLVFTEVNSKLILGEKISVIINTTCLNLSIFPQR